MKVKTAHLRLEKLRITVAGMRKGAALARHLGVSGNTVNRWLSGEVQMTFDRLNEICKFISVDVDEFLEIKQAA